MKIIWWGGWPWKWRFYLVRRSRYGAWGELMLGFVSIVWATDRPEPPEDSAHD